MYGVRHPITREFPEFSGKIELLKRNNQAFSRLLSKYEETDKKIYGYEQLKQPLASTYFELKKWRLVLKDQLYSMLRQKQSTDQMTG